MADQRISRQVSYDERAITIDGARTFIISGAIHYPRSTPAMWPHILRQSREAGLNTIETYVFWNFHERQQGIFDFSDRLDLMHFCELAQAEGLDVILRIGPYICAEINYGGFPFWLREVPDIQFRTWNEPFMREQERWVRYICDYMQPMFASQGGPIILAQIENEYSLIADDYGEDGKRYLQWCSQLGADLNLGIPWIMCFGGTEGVIETINGFEAHLQLPDHLQRHPDQPALWTENWPGWYDVFGRPHHLRSAEQIAYAVARFVAEAGTGINYYMWHGGTNFNRESMYLQTTSYDFDAPLDEFGLPTTKLHHLARLHQVLHKITPTLLSQPRAKAQQLGDAEVVFSYGTGDDAVTFLCNDSHDVAANTTYKGQIYHLLPQSAIILQGTTILIETNKVAATSVITRNRTPIADPFTAFTAWDEPLPQQSTERSHTHHSEPIEQLLLTHDESDYCWYTTLLHHESAILQGTLTLAGMADLAHIYVDGVYQATTTTHILEDRGLLTDANFTQTVSLDLSAGDHQLAILCCAVGLIKGDWLIGHTNMVQERKGIWGEVRWNGIPVLGDWTMYPRLVGEQQTLFASNDATRWQQVEASDVQRPLRWWRTQFARPDATAGTTGLVLDMASMTKGLMWLNGHCLGRYWLVTATDEQQKHPLTTIGTGQPTQRYYHVPIEWLADTNSLVLFEEVGGDPAQIQLCWID